MWGNDVSCVGLCGGLMRCEFCWSMWGLMRFIAVCVRICGRLMCSFMLGIDDM